MYVHGQVFISLASILNTRFCLVLKPQKLSGFVCERDQTTNISFWHFIEMGLRLAGAIVF